MTATANVLIAGEALVDFVPEGSGSPGEAGGYSPRFGGAPANVALAMARLGVPPLLWTRLATDDFGNFLRSQLTGAGVPDELLVTDADARTTLALVTHDGDGDRSFTFYRDKGADTRLATGTVTESTIDAVDWVHTSGVPLSVEPSHSAILDLQSRASERATVSLDPNWRPELWQDAREYRAVVRDALEDVDVVKASPDDLAAAGFETGDPEHAAQSVVDLGPHTVVVTRGGDGAVAYGTKRSPLDGLARHEGYEVDVVDTTGAGDVFLAGFIAALTNGVRDGEQALGLANAAGAVATTRQGAVTALTGSDALYRHVEVLPWEG